MEVRFVVFLCADALDNYIYRAHQPRLIPKKRVTRPVRASKNQIPRRTRGQKNRHHQVGRLALILHPPPVDPLDQWLRFAHGAISPNTERALRADLGIYRSWCEHRQLIPWPVNATPVARFIDSMASRKAPATVRRYVASISALCRAAGRKNPLDSVMVTTALQRMHRQKGRRQVQAHGLTWALREQLLVASGDRLIDTRNRALLAVAYDALLRRSELVSLQVLDLMMENDGSAALFIRRGKTDQEGEGAMLFLAPDSVTLVREWIKRGAITGGLLFRSLPRGGLSRGPLNPGQVSRIYKSMARKAGLGEDIVTGLSGHSARVGAVQDMIASGIELPAILQAGRWKSTTMVNRYGERLLARRSGSAQLAELQNRTFHASEEALEDQGQAEKKPGKREEKGKEQAGKNTKYL